MLAAALLAAGCGRPPDMQPDLGVPVPSPSTTPIESRPPVPTPTASHPASAPTFSETYYVACLGSPSGDQVIATLRHRSGLLPRTGTVTVPTGPLCSGSWQYTIVQAPRKEPLLVVTQGAPNALRIVTAGSDVCTITVRTQAPAGLLAAARC
jgi:hypothetical protein